MEGEHGDFNSKAKEEREEQPDGVMECDFRSGLIESRDREGVNPSHGLVVEIQEQDAQQHQHRAEQRVQEKLYCGIKLARTTPDADEQVHGD